MKRFTSLPAIADERLLPWLGAIVGGIWAGWVIFQSYGIINNDGILYIEVAKQFDAGEWRKGLALYNWPFYPLLIAATHQISGLGFQASAHLLAVIFFALASAGIVALTREAGGNRCAMLAAGVLLLCSPYIVRNLLPMIARDHGFLASHIWSIVCFLRFYRNNTWSSAWAWGAMAILATLFRIEGIIYLALLPLVLLAKNTTGWRNRIKITLKVNTLPIAAATAIAGYLLFHPAITIEHLGRLQDPVNVARNAYLQLTQGLAEKAEIYAESVLGTFMDGYALPGLLLTLVLVLLGKVAASAGWLQLACAVYSRTFTRSAAPNHGIVFGWLLLIGLINATFIILSAFLLSTRYVLPIAVIVLVYGSFGLAALFESWKSKEHMPGPVRSRQITISVFLLAMLAIIWPPHNEDQFELNAAHWIKSQVSAGSKIYYDHGRLSYYATGDSRNRAEASWEELRALVSSNHLRNYDYISVHVSYKHPEQQQFLTEKIGAQPQALFESRRGKKVLIYKVQH